MAKKKTLHLSTIIMLITSTITVLVCVVLGVLLTNFSVGKMKTMIRNKALELANTAAGLLDGESLKGMTKEDVGSEKYNEAFDILKAFKNYNEGSGGELAFIYLCRSKGNNEFEFVLDTDPEDPAEFGEYLEWTEALDSASKGISEFDKKPYTDEWGTFYSAYAPVFNNPQTKDEVTMIVGIDIWADWYNSTIKSTSRYIIIATSIAGSLGLLSGILINLGIRRRFSILTEEMNDLESDVQTLISEIKEPIDSNEQEEIDSSSKDQVAQLRNKIHITQKEIKDYIIYTKKQAYVDALSRVNNRTAYAKRINEIDYENNFAVFLFDIDKLKNINDKYGHDNGDKAIIAVATILKSVYHKDDIFRIGGDEFVVLLTNNDETTTKEIYNSVDLAIEEYNAKGNLPFPVSISKGIAFYDRNIDNSYLSVFNRADEDMYKNKSENKKHSDE